MIGSTVSTFANTQYKCCECNKILWDKYSRLKGKKGPSVIINGVSYCNRCADKYLIADPGGISGEKGGRHEEQPERWNVY
jgi:hypothetical protein